MMIKETPTVQKRKAGKKRKQVQMQVLLASEEIIDLFGIGGSLKKYARHIERKGLYIRIKEAAGSTGVRHIPAHSITEIRWSEKRR